MSPATSIASRHIRQSVFPRRPLEHTACATPRPTATPWPSSPRCTGGPPSAACLAIAQPLHGMPRSSRPCKPPCHRRSHTARGSGRGWARTYLDAPVVAAHLAAIESQSKHRGHREQVTGTSERRGHAKECHRATIDIEFLEAGHARFSAAPGTSCFGHGHGHDHGHDHVYDLRLHPAGVGFVGPIAKHAPMRRPKAPPHRPVRRTRPGTRPRWWRPSPRSGARSARCPPRRSVRRPSRGTDP